MLKKILNVTLVCVTSCLIVPEAWAALVTDNLASASLMDVYQQALKNDPIFKQAEADMLTNKENVPISRAALLPSLTAMGELNRQVVYNGSGRANYNTEDQYSLTLTQPIFNYANWKSLDYAKAGAKVAEATYSAAAQDLMSRVATAYFNVLQSSDTLRFTLAQKRALGRQLEQANHRYRVGLIAITDVYQARAAYDAVLASEISARNTMAINLETLRQITGHTYTVLQGPNDHLPLVTPVPNNIEQWVNTATRQNYNLLSARYALIAAQENIKVQFGGHLPTLNAVGSYGVNNNSNPAVSFNPINAVGSVGLSVNLPVYQGGRITAQTQQAEYKYQSAAAQLEQAYRNTVTQTRQSYLNVSANISKINADKQSVLSNQSALQATEASYAVGAKTIVDVLTAQTNLFQAQQQYSQDQYTYLLNTISLKQAAGILKPDDLAIMNNWLRKQVDVTGKSRAYYGSDGNVARTLAEPVSYGSLPALEDKNDNNQAISKDEVNATSPASTTISTEIVKKPAAVNSVTDNNNLAGQVIAPQHYTIQIATASTREEAQHFIANNKLNAHALALRVERNNEAWYAIVYGNYTTLESAKAAKVALPAKFKSQQPWIRKFGSIH